ncbi:unnamed protein product, partial [Rotaria sp. Silwood1]
EPVARKQFPAIVTSERHTHVTISK